MTLPLFHDLSQDLDARISQFAKETEAAAQHDLIPPSKAALILTRCYQLQDALEEVERPRSPGNLHPDASPRSGPLSPHSTHVLGKR